MSDDRNWKSLIRDLKNRKVFRSALAYAVVGWAVIQGGDILLPIYDAPRWSMQALVTLVLIGFPLFIVLAWSYDFTKSGLKRTVHDTATSRALQNPTTRFGLASVAVLGTGVVVWWVWAGYFSGVPDHIAPASRSGTQNVAVAQIENLTGDESLNWISVGFANLLRDNLAQSRHLIVTSDRRIDTLRNQAGDDAGLEKIALNAGIDYIVSGEFIATGDSLTLTARVTDLEGGVNLIAQSFRDLTPSEMIALADRIATLTKQGLGVPHTEEVVRFASDFVVENMAAYEVYLDGLQSLVDFEYDNAEEAFRTALTQAPDFHIARYNLAVVHDSTGRTEQALDILANIPDDAILSVRERLYIDAAKAKFARDSQKAVEIYQSLFDQFPYDTETGQLLAEAHWNNFDDAAAIAQLENLIELEPENPAGYMALGERQVELGDLENAKSTLDHYVSLDPEDPYGHTLLGDLEQLSDDQEQALVHYGKALTISPGFPHAELGLARSNYVMGRTDEAESIWRQIIANTNAEHIHRIDSAFDLTGVLRGQKRFEEALLPLSDLENEIREEQIREAMALSTLGMTQMELGDIDQARSLIDLSIERAPIVPTRYLFARGMLENRLGDAVALRATAEEIRSHALPPEDSDRTENKAAAYLDGLAALLDDDIDRAIGFFEAAIKPEGYRYAIYELGLAEAYAASGESDKALAMAREVLTQHDPGDLRLDLDLGRTRASTLVETLISNSR